MKEDGPRAADVLTIGKSLKTQVLFPSQPGCYVEPSANFKKEEEGAKKKEPTLAFSPKPEPLLK